ncbi:MAG TPA: ATP-binding cassette domain-containing protein [Kiritimatiellia bacterium]|nr:ATP-binding cassette domain-containing protein [Kiritimatiellia bacterium]HMP32792.1 ATP-binding cassette domain-containing protein [Kiritimatiellia bacterium]
MITVSHLTKTFPGRVAVNDLSFEVGHSEVVGFLGPNGSGKTTTMRILAGYLPASAGVVKVAGFDVARHPLEVRKRIGYLPENCPLYPDMRVDEYLRFRAALKGVPRPRRRERIAEVKELCGLTDSGGRIIGQLSKGYRQRVGLAETLVHDPELLILDEPTIGLDPNQIRQVRQLIHELGRRHTILLSTHILSEVEATCRRVLIIKQGRIVAADATDRLLRHMKGMARITAEIKAPRDLLAAELGTWPDLTDLAIETDGEWLRLSFHCPRAQDPRSRLFTWIASRGWLLRDLHLEAGTLEDLFVSLTNDAPAALREPGS